MQGTINLTGFQTSGYDTIDRLVKAYQPLIRHMGHDDTWFREEIFSGLVHGVPLNNVIQGLNRYAQLVGLTVQGAPGAQAA